MNSFDIRRYGSVENTATKAIQAAIDACHAAGGGVVYCPPGEFLTGTLWLKSRVNLHLAPGCRLLGSPERADYAENPVPESVVSPNEKVSNAHLLIAYRAEDVSITGNGTIDGNGPAFLPHLRTGQNEPWGWRPAQMVYFCLCREVVIENVRLNHATYWTLFFHGCERVRVHCISINNHDHTPNGDGIDVDCCREVCIDSCQINSGDDSITLRANEEPLGSESRPCEQVVVTNCVLHSRCNAIRVGVGRGTIRNCTFDNVVVRASGIGVNVISRYPETPHAAEIRHLRFGNMIVEADIPLYVSTGEQGAAPVQDIVFCGVDLRGRKASYIGGTADNLLSRLALQNVSLAVSGGENNRHCQDGFPGNPEWTFRSAGAPYGLVVVDVEEIELENVRLRWSQLAGTWECCLLALRVARLLLSRVAARSPGTAAGRTAIVRCRDCRVIVLHACRAEPGTGTFLALEGQNNVQVRLLGNDFTDAATAFTGKPDILFSEANMPPAEA